MPSSKQQHLDADLMWFFNDASGALGLRAASLEPMSRGGEHEWISSMQIGAAGRHRKIAESLHSLAEATQRTLLLAHTPTAPGLRPHYAPLGELAGVVVHDLDPVWLAGALHWVGSRGKKSAASRAIARGFLAMAIAEARAVVRRAILEYRLAKAAAAAGRSRRIADRRRAREELLYGVCSDGRLP